MMSERRKSLDFDDLDDFKPRKPAQQPTAPAMKEIDRVTSFPSREATDDAQINIKTSSAILDRFRALAKAKRYKHGEFLETLMNAYEGRVDSG